MTRPFAIAAIAATCIALSGCVIAVERAAIAGPATPAAGEAQRRFDVAGFEKVDLASSDRVVIVVADRFAVTAAGDPRAVAALAITVRDGMLRVDRIPGRYRDRGATVTVTMPVLRAASLSGSGSLRADGVTGPGFVGELAGSGSMTLTGLTAASVRLDLGGSGSIVADGRTDAVDIDLGGSGRVDAQALATPMVAIDMGGSGSIVAAASRAATIEAGGSGTVRVTGGARCDVHKSGSAIVRCG
ncbi:head GIN domain-containing protein [Sphingomonas sp. CFBP 8760]|uniref:head GIN domain-containing protein n=1 Tax=Sphingomonas sp. CFBP 8760 TaxID=2775282 RepID=UPI00177BB28F|nr:head GIN domain-containing protein [Sphingomonas sp. CFBP 8760]MBD8547093.1 DUF2807 domain-containing protein [Sphingomonas sp. CFBP 8760]